MRISGLRLTHRKGQPCQGESSMSKTPEQSRVQPHDRLRRAIISRDRKSARSREMPTQNSRSAVLNLW